MSKCDLRLELENPDAAYKAGETIRGVLVVEVDNSCKCDKLTVEMVWRTHGRGNRDTGTPETIVLFQGQWRAGETARYPFSFTAPRGPATYHGKLLNVDWYLRARADIPWAIDPKAETEILLWPEGEGEYFEGPGHAEHDFGPLHGEKLRLAKAGIGGVMAAGGGVWLATELPDFADLHFGHAIDLLFPAVLLVVGLTMLVTGVWNTLAQRKLGTPSVSLSPQALAPGAEVRVDVELQPKGKLTLEDVFTELIGMERVVSGSGTNRTTHTHVVHKSRQDIDLIRRALPASMPTTLNARVPIPQDAPPSFSADDNALRWSLRVHIGVDNWPDWDETYPLTIRPG